MEGTAQRLKNQDGLSGINWFDALANFLTGACSYRLRAVTVPSNITNRQTCSWLGLHVCRYRTGCLHSQMY
jgi:hypothetical protein